MPAARTDINKEGLCAAVALKGYRAAARQFDVPVATVFRIAKAAGVKPGVPQSKPNPERVSTSEASERIETPARSNTPAHTVITQYASDLAERCQLALLERNTHVLEYAAKIAKTQPGRALAQTQDVLGTARAAAIGQTPGFRAEGDQRPSGQLTHDQVATVIERAMQRIPEIEAEIIAVEQKLRAVEQA